MFEDSSNKWGDSDDEVTVESEPEPEAPPAPKSPPRERGSPRGQRAKAAPAARAAPAAKAPAEQSWRRGMTVEGGPPKREPKKKAPKAAAKLPDGPPFVAFVANLSFDCTSDALAAFLDGKGCASSSLRLPAKDGKAAGFAYCEFADRDKLSTCLKLDGAAFLGRPLSRAACARGRPPCTCRGTTSRSRP